MTCTVTVVPTVNAGALQAPLITNSTIAVADTEQSFTFQTSMKKFDFFNEGSAVIKFTYHITESGTRNILILPSTSYGEENISLASLTVYIQSPVAGTAFKVLEWA